MARDLFVIAGTAIGAYFGGAYGAKAGAAIGGAIGGYVGGQVGEAVDPINVQGPRLADLRIGVSTYGVAIPLVYGADNRVAGNVIWSTGLRERRHREDVGKGGGDTITTYTYSTLVAVAIGTGPCKNVRKVWANGKLIFDIADVSFVPPDYTPWTATALFGEIPEGAMAQIAFFPGTQDQMPLGGIQGYEGVANTPAYRGTCYVGLNLELADFGNALPNLEFEIDGLAPRDTHAIVKDINERAGLTVDEFSVDTTLGQIPVAGYAIASSGSAMAAVQTLSLSTPFDAVERNGAIHYVARGHGPKASIPLDDMAARTRTDDAQSSSPISISRVGDTGLPRSVTVTYRDKARDYQENSQNARRDLGETENSPTFALMLTMENEQARKVADRLLWGAWSGRIQFAFSVSERFGWLSPGDVVTVPVAGVMRPVRLLSCARGNNGVINISALSEDVFAYDGSTAGASPAVPANVIALVGETFIYVFNAPLLFPSDAATGFPWAMDADEPGWRGGQIFRSSDELTYGSVGAAGVRNITGTVAVPLAEGVTDVFDHANTLTVVLHYDAHELSSFEEIEILNGKNACFLGAPDGSHGEVLQFSVATLISSSPRTYLLSGLLRGRRATEHETGLHAAGDVFVLLEKNFAHSLDYASADWYRTYRYKGVSVYQAEIDVTAYQEFENIGERAMTRSPVHGEGERDGSDNLTITWVPRTRAYGPGIGYGPVPIPSDDLPEAYEIDVTGGRTLTSSAPLVAYSAAEQTADGLTPGAPVTISIYQISPTRGRGHPGVFEV